MEDLGWTTAAPNQELKKQNGMTAMVVSVTTQGLICLWTVLANGLVLVTLCGSRQLRSIMTSFLVSLAAADFMLGVAMVLSIAITIWTPPFWPCLITYCILIGQCVASVWSLMGVAIDRYLHIVGHKLKWRITEWYAQLSIVTIWVISFTTAAVPIIMHANSAPGSFEDGKTCVDFTALFHRTYLEFIFYGHECIPVVFMVLMYSHITVILLQKMRRVDPVAADNVVGDTNVKCRKELKVIVKLAVLLCIFSICMFPMVIGVLMEIYDPEFTLPPLPRLTMVALTYFNSAINPVLFWFFKSQFRKSCARLLRSGWRKLTSPPFCPRTHIAALDANTRRGQDEDANDPSALPTINLTTYHCDERGCKRTHHRENIRDIPPCNEFDCGNEGICPGEVFSVPHLPEKVQIDDDITRSEESTMT